MIRSISLFLIICEESGWMFFFDFWQTGINVVQKWHLYKLTRSGNHLIPYLAFYLL